MSKQNKKAENEKIMVDAIYACDWATKNESPELATDMAMVILHTWGKVSKKAEKPLNDLWIF
jgi:hypothetical protein